MGFLTKTEFEKEFESLSNDEKHIINTTALSIDDIRYYEEMINRKMILRELKIAALLCNNGVLLNENDFKKL